MALPISEVEMFEAFLDNTNMVSLAHQTQSEKPQKMSLNPSEIIPESKRPLQELGL